MEPLVLTAFCMRESEKGEFVYVFVDKNEKPRFLLRQGGLVKKMYVVNEDGSRHIYCRFQDKLKQVMTRATEADQGKGGAQMASFASWKKIKGKPSHFQRIYLIIVFLF
jgi:hypothetical protein